MEVKPGYKQTEVGVIPEEWELRNLGVICDVRDGTHESPRFFTDGVPFVTSKNIVNGRLDLENVSFISKADAIEFDKRSKVDRNDILLSMIGTIGSAVLVDCEPSFCIKNVALLKPRNVAPTFLIQLINSPVFQRYLADNLDGGIQKFISLGTLRQLSITLPDETEQRAIAEALSDVDGLLGGLDRLIAKKRDLKQAAMQQLLTGQIRLPGYDGEREVKTLAEVGRSFAGGTPSTFRPDYWGGDVYWLPSGRVQNDILPTPLESEITITQRGLDESAAKKIKANSVLVAITGATCGNVALLKFSAAANQSVVAIEPDDKTDARYLFYSLLMEQKQILSRQSGSAQGGVNLKTVKSIEVRFPCLAEQSAIAEVLTEMDAELAALEQRREKTRALKQAMMQELLTGKTRLV